jgi:hypothetical protein
MSESLTVVLFYYMYYAFQVIIPRDLIALLERNRALGEMAMGTAVQQPPSNPPVYPGNHSRIM